MPPLNKGGDDEEHFQSGSEVDIDHVDGDLDDEDEEDDMIANLPPYVLHRLDKLKEIELERKTIAEQYLLERAALEKKFAEMHLPLNERRREIVTGEKDEELDAHIVIDVVEGGIKEKGIPNFWFGCMSRIEAISDLIFEDDLPCLESLKDITCVDDADGKGFTLKFYFEDNAYFYDTVLTKSYRVPNLLVSDEPVLQSFVGCKINWKPDGCLTTHMVEKKQQGTGKNAGKLRTVKKEEKKDSFFNWFDPPQMPEDLDNLEEADVEVIESIMEEDFEAALAFRIHVVPNATLWFTGEAGNDALDDGIISGEAQ